MKTKIKREVEMEIRVCNICGEEIKKDPYNMKRIEIIRNLFQAFDFDGHEKCVNSIIKESFKEFIKT